MAKYNANGSIDLEYNHPQYGLIPFTASPEDVEELGRELYQRALDGEFGEIEAYSQPVAPPEQVKLQRIAELKQLLSTSDFKVLSDYQSTKTQAENDAIIAQRALWRDEIRELEA